MALTELRPALWSWSADHPEWEPGQDWPREVRSFAHAGEEGLLLIDPLAGDWSDVDRLAENSGGVAAVALTVGFHQRAGAEAAQRYGVPLFAPPSSKPRPALAGANLIEDRDELPGGARAIAVERAEEALLYLAGPRVLVAGDTLLARDGELSLCPASWLGDQADLPRVRDDVARALELPLEAVAVSHGEPALFERAALEQALRTAEA